MPWQLTQLPIPICIMGFSPFLLQHVTFVVVLAILSTFAIAQEGVVVNNAEIDALLVLRTTFNDPFLNGNWTGLHCNINDPPRWFGIQCANGHVTGIVLEGMGLKGEINAEAFFNLQELNTLSFKNNFLCGNVMDFSNNYQMKHIDLSGNEFNGLISRSLQSLNLLETLFLQGNKLTGSIPEFTQSSLKNFNVSNNDLEGPVPTTPIFQSFDPSSFSGNPKLCVTTSLSSYKISPNSSPIPAPLKDSDNNNENQNNKSSDKDHTPTILLIFNVVLLLAIILLLMLYYNTSRKLSQMMKGQPPIAIENEMEESVEKKIEIGEGTMMQVEQRKELIFYKEKPQFQMGELLRASAESLGQGIMGNSYKAMLNNGGPTIVVKRLRDLKPLTDEEFAKILHLISNLKHTNLLPLLAYYHSREEKLLLYRYAQKGNLFSRLHDGRGGNRVPFKWDSRLSVARGVARALEYLHLNTTNTHGLCIVPHGNLKASNVLLDENDVVLVSDYGMASLIAQPIAAQRMVVYKSPEYGYTRKVTMQSDVWSYGSLLIELLTGKISACSASPGSNGVDLSNWVHRAVREEWTAEIFDKEIAVQKRALPGMLRLLHIAMRCIERFPENRPDMREVVREVEKIQAPLNSEDNDDVSGDVSSTDDSVSTSTSIAD